MRVLILVPIVHAEHDMGSLIEKVKEEYVRRHGPEKWDEHVRTIHGLWAEIRKAIESLDLPYQSVRLYQDGLPECGRELDIVGQLADKGSPNHQLLRELVARGAKLMGTENPELLVQEYRLHTEAAATPPREAAEQEQDLTRRLLAARDRHIAARINATLMADEIGLLFLGLAHSAEGLLDSDILVKTLLPWPREGQGKGANGIHWLQDKPGT